jgi:tetratricopeptide (TPR) repeat protein
MLEASILRTRAHLEAMQGSFDEARRLIAEGKSLTDDLGVETASSSAGEIELLAGDLPAAEHAIRTVCETLERRGDWGHLASSAPVLADALHAQGRGDEAAPLIELAAGWTLADDVDAQVGLLRIRANLLAHQGDLGEAVRLAREATELSAQTDYLNHHAKALADLADVLELTGRREEAAAAMERALELYERKGNLVMAERTREQLS